MTNETINVTIELNDVTQDQMFAFTDFLFYLGIRAVRKTMESTASPEDALVIVEKLRSELNKKGYLLPF